MKFAKKILYQLVSTVLLAAILASSAPFAERILPGSALCHAERDPLEEMEQRKTLPIQSNEIADWPEGPAVGAQSAILMEMNTHTILYAKNIHEKSYPASTTKIMTCLLAMQNCTMDEIITFSRESIYDVPGDGSKLGGVDTGDTILMENALYCVLVQSANEVASAVGEHVAEKLGKEKSVAAFAQLMNQKAKELGCTETNFVNCNGLYDDNHYTSAHDLALIGCEFFSNELLCKMSSSPNYHFRLQPEDEEDTWIASKNQLYKGKPYAYSHLLGSKTGYVSQSRQTLVSAAEKNGMKLVCVVFAEETPYQFEDTIALFQYGFENFKRVSVYDNETQYKINTLDFFDTDHDLFGDSTPLISMEENAYVILPNTAEFSEMASTLTYTDAIDGKYVKTDEDNIIATIHYKYSGVDVGSCNIVLFQPEKPVFSFAADNPAPGSTQPSTAIETESSSEAEDSEEDANIIYINVKRVILIVLAGAAVVILILFAISTINSYNFSPKGQSNKRRRSIKKETRTAKRQARRTARLEKKLRKRRIRNRKRH